MTEDTSRVYYVSRPHLFEHDGTSPDVCEAVEIAVRSHGMYVVGIFPAYSARPNGTHVKKAVPADAAGRKAQPIAARPETFEGYVNFWTPTHQFE